MSISEETSKGPWWVAGRLGHGILIRSMDEHIAVVYGDSTNPHGEQNAQMLAASKEMYIALRLMLSEFGSASCGTFGDLAKKAARAAVASADGGKAKS